MKLKEYKERLKKHDWYYVMTDDPRVYDEGLERENELKKLAGNNKSFKAAYEKQKSLIFKTNGNAKKVKKITSKKSS